MATVLNRATKILLRSVNTLDYSAVDWIINPDMSAVSGFESIYWVIVGDNVLLMSENERNAVDQKSSGNLIDADKTIEKNKITKQRALVALAKVILSEVNILRVEAGLTERTRNQLRRAIINEIDNG